MIVCMFSLISLPLSSHRITKIHNVEETFPRESTPQVEPAGSSPAAARAAVLSSPEALACLVQGVGEVPQHSWRETRRVEAR